MIDIVELDQWILTSKRRGNRDIGGVGDRIGEGKVDDVEDWWERRPMRSRVDGNFPST